MIRDSDISPVQYLNTLTEELHTLEVNLANMRYTLRQLTDEIEWRRGAVFNEVNRTLGVGGKPLYSNEEARRTETEMRLREDEAVATLIVRAQALERDVDIKQADVEWVRRLHQNHTIALQISIVEGSHT